MGGKEDRSPPQPTATGLFSALWDVGCYSNMVAGYRIRRSLEKTETTGLERFTKGCFFESVSQGVVNGQRVVHTKFQSL